MIRKNYNKKILQRIESSFDKVLPVAAAIAILSSLAIYFSAIPLPFLVLNAGIGIVFLLMYVWRRRLKVEAKITVTLSIPIIIAVLSFLDGGFSSSATTLLLISNIVGVLFLRKRSAYMLSALSVLILTGLWAWASTQPQGDLINIGGTKWFIQVITFILCVVMLHTIVYSIKRYLLENIEELEESVNQTYQLAYFDQLTGLPNQFLFRQNLFEKIENHHHGYLVFFSLKNLSIINSVYGEETGNSVLVETANILGAFLNDSELSGRVAGNEFTLWLNTGSDIEQRLKSMVRRFQTKFYVKNMKKKVEFYIGYVHYPDECDSAKDCYQKGTLALTYAKTHDMVPTVPYNKTLHDAISYEEEIKDQLEKAISSGEINLYFQTKVDAASEKIVGVEALARWNSASLGSIPPNIFIPLLEKTNLSISFGEFIVKKALSQYQDLCEKYHDTLLLSINISPVHLISKGFARFIKDALKEYNVKPERVILEITEDIMIEGIENVSELIESLKKIKLKISLDDFGSGYSSLNYLTVMDIDELKIDKSFVDQLETNEKIGIMLELLIKFSQAYGLSIVAEGVETREQCNQLVKLGCRIIQGYYYSKPEPI